jgi:hypothetical protein
LHIDETEKTLAKLKMPRYGGAFALLAERETQEPGEHVLPTQDEIEVTPISTVHALSEKE